MRLLPDLVGVNSVFMAPDLDLNESVETWISLDASGTVAGACATSNREGRMTFMVMILSVGLLSATGIYNPQVMRDGHCIAEPGTFDALYCPAPAAPPHPHG